MAFLDTNYLHCVGLYLRHAEEEGLFPYVEHSASDGRQEALDSISSFPESHSHASLRRGLGLLHCALTHNLEIHYGPISELELITQRTRGKAIVSAASEGLPGRMWTRFPEEAIPERVAPAEMSATKEAVDRLAAALRERGVVVTAGMGGKEDFNTLELAKALNGRVYVDVLDSIVYASALLAQADYLLTGDGYLRRTANLIQNPEHGSHFEEIRQELRELIAALILGDPEKVHLPSAHSVATSGEVSLPISQS